LRSISAFIALEKLSAIDITAFLLVLS